MDRAYVVRDTLSVLGPGANRQRLARTLNAAYAEGLLSERTLAHRLDALFAGELIDPARLVGDLTRRASHGGIGRTLLEGLNTRLRRVLAWPVPREPGVLLALDWTGACEELLIGRHPSCDVIVPAETVSRQHARRDLPGRRLDPPGPRLDQRHAPERALRRPLPAASRR